MIKSNCNSIKHEQKSTLKLRSYALIILVIMIKMITMFISLLMKTMNSISIDYTSTQKINQTFSQKFKTEIYFSTWNWQISNWENCWHVSRNFLIIHSRSESTSSYFYWIRFLLHDWFSLYFIHQISRYIFLFVKKASTYCV